MVQYDIPPDDCLIALQFRESVSLREVANRIGVDPSALLRKVQRIAEEHELLEKIKGRWVLTTKGHLLNRWTEDSLISQKKILETKPHLRIGTTTWLAEQIVIPFFACLQAETEQKYQWTVRSPQRSFEAEIMEGTCDFVIACKAPIDPLIAYKRIAPEKWTLIAPLKWQKELQKISPPDLLTFLFSKNFVRHIDFKAEELLNTPDMNTNDTILVDNLIGVRSAVTAGYGWSLVPRFSVLKEIRCKELIELEVPQLKELNSNHLCLWWLRTRREPRKVAQHIQSWLEKSLPDSRK